MLYVILVPPNKALSDRTIGFSLIFSMPYVHFWGLKQPYCVTFSYRYKCGRLLTNHENTKSFRRSSSLLVLPVVHCLS